jgi:hypothetical protein
LEIRTQADWKIGLWAARPIIAGGLPQENDRQNTIVCPTKQIVAASIETTN